MTKGDFKEDEPLTCKKCGSKKITEYRSVKNYLSVEIENGIESSPHYEFDVEYWACAVCGEEI